MGRAAGVTRGETKTPSLEVGREVCGRERRRSGRAEGTSTSKEKEREGGGE